MVSEPTPTSRQVLAQTVVVPSLFLLLAMLNQTLVVAGLKELIIDRLGGTALDASLFFSIEMLAYIVFAPVWGLLSDRLGRRRALVVVGFLASAPFYAAYATVSEVGTLLALRFVQGAFTVMGWSTLMAIVLDQPDRRRRGRHMGLMGGALGLGVSIGAPLGGLITGRWGATAPLWTAAALFLLVGVGSLWLGDPPRGRQRAASLRGLLHALHSRPRLLLPYLFHFVDRFTVGFFVVLFPLYLASTGAAPGRRGAYLALFLLPFALLQPVTGRLTERFGPYRPLVLGSLVYGLLLCAVGYAGRPLLASVMVLLGVLAAVMFPPSIALTAQLSDRASRGSAMGGFNLAGSLGFAAGPLVGSWAQRTAGYGFAFLVAGAMELVAVAVTLAVLRGRLPAAEADG